MGFLRRIGRTKPRTGDFYRDADRVKRVPEAEIAVVESALRGGGPLAHTLVRQLHEAPAVYRLRGEDGAYELRVSTLLEVNGVPRDGWRSRPIPIRTASGRDLTTLVVVHEAGIIGIEGSTRDGRPWPDEWTVTQDVLATIEEGAPWLPLPSDTEVDDQRTRAAGSLEAWLGSVPPPVPLPARLSARPPARESDLGAFAEREGFVLPEAYEALLRSADGVDIGDLSVLGTADAYRLDVQGAARLVICPPDEDGAVVLELDGQVVQVDIDDPGGAGMVLAEDLRAYVASRLDV